AFFWYGLDVIHANPTEVGKRIKPRAIRMQLVTALDHWASLLGEQDIQGRARLLVVARTADPDPWRDRLRDALEGKDTKALEELATPDSKIELPPATAALLPQLTLKTPEVERVVLLLRRIQQRHPNDFWVNYELACRLDRMQSPRLKEAIRYYTVAVALRPQSPGVHLNLGIVLQATGRPDEAMVEFQEAIRLKKDFVAAHYHLVNILHDKGRLDEAIAEYRAYYKGYNPFTKDVSKYREAIRLKKGVAEAHNHLGNTLQATGRLDEAIAEYREAIRIKNDSAEEHTILGHILQGKGQLDEAITEHREAIRLKSDYAAPHACLGDILREKGQLDEAIAEYREVIRIKNDHPEAHINLGYILVQKGQFTEAAVLYRRGHELGSQKPGWPYPSAQW